MILLNLVPISYFIGYQLFALIFCEDKTILEEVTGLW